MENIVGRMEEKFGEDCAIHVPPKQQDNEIEQVSLRRKTEFRSGRRNLINFLIIGTY